MRIVVDDNSEANDWLGEMLNEITAKGEGLEVDLKELWPTAKLWLQENLPSRSKMNRASFKAELRGRGIKIDRDNKVHGLKIVASTYYQYA